MKATYINFKKEVTVEINLNKQNKDLLLLAWLETYHEDIYWDIEMHETGKNGVQMNAEEIMFMGDNGVFTMERVKITSI